MTDWREIGVCPHWHCSDRLHHAGLSPDGRYCFIGAIEDEEFIVWDVYQSTVLWREDAPLPTGPAPSLEELVDDSGALELPHPKPGSRYQVFGLFVGQPLTRHQALGIEVRADCQTGTLVIKALGGGSSQELPFNALSGDWAFASISADGSVIAVLEPYEVRFFGR